ncbi:MAG TPA: TonB-dependent receptor [Steroidobacteraceae bacterium]|nr:TonB-dependent receptor [Steroidobacteraceae bacterium]
MRSHRRAVTRLTAASFSRTRAAPAAAGCIAAALLAPLVAAPVARAQNGPGAAPAAPEEAAVASGTSAGSETDTDLQEVVVTATRSAQPLDETGSSVSVIGGADLATQQILVVSDALAQVPGLSVTRSGGPGQDTSVFIRGADPGETLVLIDGERINDPSTTDGEAVLGDLFVNDIERIEVLRGPQSTLYGSDAMGGIVNIITQRGGTQPFAAQVDAQGGSYGTWRVNGAAHGTAGPLEYGAGVNEYATGGVSAAADAPPDVEPDADHDLAATLNTRLQAGDGISLDLRGFYNEARYGIPGYPPPDYTLQPTPEYARDRLEAGYAGLNGSWLDGRITQRLALIGSDSDRREYGLYDPVTYAYTPAENFYAEGGATRWEYQGVIQANAANVFTYGSESELSTLDTDSLPDPADLPTTGRDRLTSYYAQWQTTFAQRSAIARQMTLTLGARRDQDQQFGGHTSLKVAGDWQLPDGATVLRGNYGQGFKAPTLYELFSQYSNPVAGLRPETADGWEAGFDHLLERGRVRVSAVYFSRDEQNEIEFDDCSSADPGCLLRPYGYYYNVGRSSDRGVESDLAAHLTQSLSVWGSYTNMQAIDELTGLRLARRPHVLYNAGLTWTGTAGASFGATYVYQGARFDDAANSIPLAPAESVDLFGTYPLGRWIQIFGRVENLFNDQAQPAYGYRPLGRGFYGGLRVKL